MSTVVFILVVLLFVALVSWYDTNIELRAERDYTAELEKQINVHRNALAMANQLNRDLRDEVSDLRGRQPRFGYGIGPISHTNAKTIQPTESGKPAESAP